MAIPRNHGFAVACAASTLVVTSLMVVTFESKNTSVPTRHEISSSAVDPPRRLVPLSVTVRVVDSKTGQPVPTFRYRTNVSNAGDSETTIDETWHDISDSSGRFTVHVNAPCELNVHATAPDFLRGYGHGRDSYVIRADATPDDVVLQLDRGITCSGKVVDSETGTPIANAKVSPVIFTPPLFTEDWDRTVTTQADGKFQLRGVDPSLRVLAQHDEYLEGGGFRSAEDQTQDRLTDLNEPDHTDQFIVVRLARGEIFHGLIVDNQGEPVPDVKVTDGAGKRATSDAEGRFILSSPSKWWNGGNAYALEFKRNGYVPLRLYPDAAPADLLRITLEELSTIRGHVMSEDGQPVTSFHVITGPGDNPADFDCKQADVDSSEGNFALPSEHKGRNWVGIRAKGFAPWEKVIDLSTASSLHVQLSKGVTVAGYVKRPSSAGREITLKLIPQRRDGNEYIVSDSPARDIATETAVLSNDGTFRFEHVRPDHYRLDVRGPEITPAIRNTIVSDTGLAVPTLELQGTGTIVGRVYNEDTGEPEAFADGSWLHSVSDSSNYTPFKTDQDGWFRISNAPIGTIRVLISFPISPDIIGGHVREAEAIDRRTTQVRFFEPGNRHQLSIVFHIGDGSATAFHRGTGMSSKRKVRNVTDRDPRFHISLKPMTPVAGSYPEADWDSSSKKPMPSLLLRDVSPGRYRLTVGDWAGWRGYVKPLKTVEVLKRPIASVVHVELGSGCVTGRIRLAEGNSRSIDVVAISQTHKTVRFTATDDNGNFCLRYLAKGKYQIYAHGSKDGWARLPILTVDEDSTDVGEIELTSGFTLSGIVSIDDGAAIPDRILAIHTSGFSIETFDYNGFDGEEYAFDGLWPGVWRLQLLRGERLISSVDTEITMSGTTRQSLKSSQ